MRIGLDMTGGDYASVEAVKGIKKFLEVNEFPNCTVIALGNEQELETQLANTLNVQIVHAPEIIEMHEHPVRALKEKANSSITIGFGLLLQKKIDAFISAGNTGAMLVGATQIIKPIHGVLRPTIPTVVPRQDGSCGLMLDVGLNADCKPENLEQFAVLGSAYAKDILGIENPKVGLLNIGEEEGKGNILAQATYPLLQNDININFIGNIEGRDVFRSKADVIVCEGFVGNVILKMAESIYDIFSVERKINDEFLNKFNYELYGGTPVLGVNQPVIVGHGISKSESFYQMLNVAAKMIQSNIMDSLRSKFIS